VFNEHTDQHRSRLRRRQRRRTGDSPGPCDRSPQPVVRSTISPALELRANGHLRISLRQAQNRCLRSNSETQLGRARIEGITVATGGKVRSAPRCLVGKPACRESSPPAEHLRRIARHFRRRITCWIRRWLGQWLRRFKGRIARWIMHWLVARITFRGERLDRGVASLDFQGSRTWAPIFSSNLRCRRPRTRCAAQHTADTDHRSV
jgi:hypothetical protein